MKSFRFHWPLWASLLAVALIAIGLEARLLWKRSAEYRERAEFHRQKVELPGRPGYFEHQLDELRQRTRLLEEAASRDGERFPEGNAMHHYAVSARNEAAEARARLDEREGNLDYHRRMWRKWDRAASRPWEKVEADPDSPLALEDLYLFRDDPRADDASLKKLSDTKKLRRLRIERPAKVMDTSVTDAGLASLRAQTRLRSLCLVGADITDAGLEHLKALRSLRCLLVESPDITDAGLEHLKGLTELDELVVISRRVTENGVARLRAALPRTDIRHYRGMVPQGVPSLKRWER